MWTGPKHTLKQERQAIAKMQERLEALKPGTPDYKQLDEQVAKAKAAFNVKASQQRKEFLDREARIYYDTYLEVNDAVKYYAQRHNLGLVVRFNGDPTDPNRREDVLRAINRPVVYQNAIDITPDVLQELNRSATVARVPRWRRPARRATIRFRVVRRSASAALSGRIDHPPGTRVIPARVWRLSLSQVPSVVQVPMQRPRKQRTIADARCRDRLWLLERPRRADRISAGRGRDRDHVCS